MDGSIYKSEYQSADVLTSSIVRITELSSLLTYSTRSLRFNFDDANILLSTMIVKQNQENCIFRIGKAVDGVGVTPLANPVDVQSDLLRGMAVLFRNGESIAFTVSPHGVGLTQSVAGAITVESVLYTEKAITNLNNQFKGTT
jgi:hypothetical protein